MTELFDQYAEYKSKQAQEEVVASLIVAIIVITLIVVFIVSFSDNSG